MTDKIRNKQLISQAYVSEDDVFPAEGEIVVDLEVYGRARKIIRGYDNKKVPFSIDESREQIFETVRYLIGGSVVELRDLIEEHKITIRSETRKGAKNLASLLGLPFRSDKKQERK
jgi:hypothetical protein